MLDYFTWVLYWFLGLLGSMVYTGFSLLGVETCFPTPLNLNIPVSPYRLNAIYNRYSYLTHYSLHILTSTLPLHKAIGIGTDTGRRPAEDHHTKLKTTPCKPQGILHLHAGKSKRHLPAAARRPLPTRLFRSVAPTNPFLCILGSTAGICHSSSAPRANRVPSAADW
ncbi:uncharacterized protein BDV14DRAFT_121850 [Aspergillus stella-maris]|uniref:uncharacterized protein n=1 Tax=Aspergillus stella-maris TaxID=1810926 RepID=UPI003CCE049E